MSKNRCTLKSKNPLVAGENHVVRQQSTAKKTGSSFRRYASRLFVLGTGSLIKSGIQQMVIPKRLDSVMLNMRPVLDVSTHPVDDEAVDTPLERGLKSSSGLFKISDPYLACLLSPSLYSMNEWFVQKLRTNPRSGTKNMFSSANGEPLNGEPVSLALSNP